MTENIVMMPTGISNSNNELLPNREENIPPCPWKNVVHDYLLTGLYDIVNYCHSDNNSFYVCSTGEVFVISQEGTEMQISEPFCDAQSLRFSDEFFPIKIGKKRCAKMNEIDVGAIRNVIEQLQYPPKRLPSEVSLE